MSCRFITTGYYLSPCNVSTKAGSTPACHCRSPHPSYSLWRPTTGRRKPHI